MPRLPLLMQQSSHKPATPAGTTSGRLTHIIWVITSQQLEV
jgi:hypothetical protein